MVIKQQHCVSLWDVDLVSSVLSGIRVARGSAEYEELSSQTTSSPSQDHCAIGLPLFQPSLPTSQEGLRCSLCHLEVEGRPQLVEHLRSAWHHCNLQRSRAGKPPLTQAVFESCPDGSSSSDSDDDDSSEEDTGEEDSDDGEVDGEGEQLDGDNEECVLRRQARLFFVNADGLVVSLYRNVCYSQKVEIDGEQDVIQRVLAAPKRKKWAVLLLAGGHFAAAIFTGREVVVHKTFHNYTVRAKQGGSQGSRDSQSATSHPRSSGASLRRYNEQSQRQHVQELMESWREHFAQCHLIFYYAKHQNRSTLFGGKSPILAKHDDRLRKIPFPTRRAKFSEVKRVFGLLSQVLVHGTEEEFQTMIKQDSQAEKIAQANIKKKKKKKESPSPKRTEKQPKSSMKNFPTHLPGSRSESEDEGEELMELVTCLTTLSTCDLGGGPDHSFSMSLQECVQAGITRSPTKKNKGPRRNRPLDKINEACKTGNIEGVAAGLEKLSASQCQAVRGSERDKPASNLPADLNTVTVDKQGRTMLHVASEHGHTDLLWWLLERGCDPGVEDRERRTPYLLAPNRDTRNCFRRFMAQHPDMYNYSKAKVPSPLTAEQEAQQGAKMAERRKAQKQAKQERMRKKKQEKREAEKEEEEKQRYLQLSDREKRALAAERRLLQQSTGGSRPVLLRCDYCATDITGAVPFEYSQYRFCSTKCVREHRTKS